MKGTLIIADAHFGKRHNIYNKELFSFEKLINEIEENVNFEVKNIILLGDIFDFWRRSVGDVLLEERNKIEELRSFGKMVIYCIGNHDYIIGDILDDINTCKYFEMNGIYFSHGYEFEVYLDDFPFVGVKDFEKFAERMCWSNNDIGFLLSEFWNIVKRLKLVGSANVDNKKLEKFDEIVGLICKYKYVVGHFHKLYEGKNGIILDALINDKVYLMSGNLIHEYDVSEKRITKDLSLPVKLK